MTKASCNHEVAKLICRLLGEDPDYVIRLDLSIGKDMALQYHVDKYWKLEESSYPDYAATVKNGMWVCNNHQFFSGLIPRGSACMLCGKNEQENYGSKKRED